MGIEIASGFTLQSPVPIDDRFRFATLAARDLLPMGSRYEGLTTYVDEVGRKFTLTGGILNENWKVDTGGGGGVGGAGALAFFKADTFENGDWSAYNDATFSVEDEFNPILAGKFFRVVVWRPTTWGGGYSGAVSKEIQIGEMHIGVPMKIRLKYRAVNSMATEAADTLMIGLVDSGAAVNFDVRVRGDLTDNPRLGEFETVLPAGHNITSFRIVVGVRMSAPPTLFPKRFQIDFDEVEVIPMFVAETTSVQNIKTATGTIAPYTEVLIVGTYLDEPTSQINKTFVMPDISRRVLTVRNVNDDPDSEFSTTLIGPFEDTDGKSTFQYVMYGNEKATFAYDFDKKLWRSI